MIELHLGIVLLAIHCMFRGYMEAQEVRFEELVCSFICSVEHKFEFNVFTLVLIQEINLKRWVFSIVVPCVKVEVVVVVTDEFTFFIYSDVCVFNVNGTLFLPSAACWPVYGSAKVSIVQDFYYCAPVFAIIFVILRV